MMVKDRQKAGGATERGDELARVPTGVPGLDRVLEGGLLQGGVYIVQGPPGAGKTILANQICFSHVQHGGGRAVYITLLAESHSRMIAHLKRLEFYEAEAVPEKLLYLSAFKVLESEGLDGLLTTVRKAVLAHKATFLVLDGLVSAEEASPTPKAYKKFIHELQIVMSMMACTGLLLSSTERARPFRPEHTMVDGIIDLSDELVQLRSVRHLQVRKMRGSDPARGKHTVTISNAGMVVTPRFEMQVRAVDEEHVTPGATKHGFGIPSLDAMLGGGFITASATMILGPTGAGKTILGMQFLAEGARRGERGVFFGFYERPASLRLKAERIGIPLHKAVDDGRVEILWHRPVENTLDLLGERLMDTVRRTGARRLFIDGLQGFESAVDGAERLRDFFAALTSELERLGVTTVFTVETRDMFGDRIEAPVPAVSAITQNVVLLRHVELRSRLYRLLSIVKLRDSAYDATVREFRIGSDGIHVEGSFASAEQIMSGTMAHAPGRRPAKGAKKKKRARRA